MNRWLTASYLILSYFILSRSLAGRWGTTVDFTTSFFHSSRFSAFRSMIFLSRPVHSLMLSSHRFFCLLLRLPPWTVPCRTVLAILDLSTSFLLQTLQYCHNDVQRESCKDREYDRDPRYASRELIIVFLFDTTMLCTNNLELHTHFLFMNHWLNVY